VSNHQPPTAKPSCINEGSKDNYKISVLSYFYDWLCYYSLSRLRVLFPGHTQILKNVCGLGASPAGKLTTPVSIQTLATPPRGACLVLCVYDDYVPRSKRVAARQGTNWSMTPRKAKLPAAKASNPTVGFASFCDLLLLRLSTLRAVLLRCGVYTFPSRDVIYRHTH
jgi:hypothetical protein